MFATSIEHGPSANRAGVRGGDLEPARYAQGAEDVRAGQDGGGFDAAIGAQVVEGLVADVAALGGIFGAFLRGGLVR